MWYAYQRSGGRPPRIAKLSPEEVQTPPWRTRGSRTKSRRRSQEVVIPAQAAAAPQSTGAFGRLPSLYRKCRSTLQPRKHTMFVLPCATIALACAPRYRQSGTEAESERVRSANLWTVLPTWARWSNSIAARLQGLVVNPATALSVAEAMPSQSAPSSAPSQSQADQQALFPRDSRRAYVAMRKHCTPPLERQLSASASDAFCGTLRKPRQTRKHDIEGKSQGVIYEKSIVRPSLLNICCGSLVQLVDARRCGLFGLELLTLKRRQGRSCGRAGRGEAGGKAREYPSFAPSTTMDSNTAQPTSPLRQDVPRIKLEPVSSICSAFLLNSRSEMTTSLETGVQVKAVTELGRRHYTAAPWLALWNAVTASGETT